jgi:heptosyltransferase-2
VRCFVPTAGQDSNSQEKNRRAISLARILVVAPNWIGDVLIAQPLLARLREISPETKVDLLAPEWVAPVARRMPEVDEVIAAPFRHGALQLGSRWTLGRALKARRYDRALVLPNTWKSALIPFFAGIPERVGYLGEMRFGLLNRIHEKRQSSMREHYARLAGSPDGEPKKPRLRVDAQEIDDVLKKFSLEKPYAVLCPGAEYGPAKRWPYFAALSEKITIKTILLGAASDIRAAESIPGKNLVGKTTLDEAIALIAGARFVVTNDSGLMHVAAALGRPQVALFGSSSPEHTPPQSPAARVLWLHIECSPCYQRVCPLGHFRCMKELSVDRVLSEVKSL